MRLASAAVLLALAIVAPAAADAPVHAAHGCPQITIHNRLAAIATVERAHGMSCRRARKIVRRNGRKADPDEAFHKGGRFKLGRFRCRVTFHREESNRARCHRGKPRVFLVDYGS